MKKELPPWVAIVVIVAIVLGAGFYLWRSTGPGGGKAKEMEDMIKATVATGAGGAPGAPKGAPGVGPGGTPPPPGAQVPGGAPK